MDEGEDLYEELPQTEADELYVDTEGMPLPPPPGELVEEELYDECLASPAPPPLPPLVRHPQPPPVGPAPPPPPPIPDFRRRGSESPPKVKRKSTPTTSQSQGIDMSEILQKRKQLQKVGSRVSSDGLPLPVDTGTGTGGSIPSPPWQTKPLKTTVDQTEQGKKNDKPQWLQRPLKRVGDRPPSVSADSIDGDKGGSLPFQVRLKKTGIALATEGQSEEETGATSSNDREVLSLNAGLKFPKPAPKPRPMARSTQQVENTTPTTPTRPPRNSCPSEVTKTPPRPPSDDLSERPPPAIRPSQLASSPVTRSQPKSVQDVLPPKPGILPPSSRMPRQIEPTEPPPPEPAEPPPPPPLDDDEDADGNVNGNMTPPDISRLRKPGVSPPDVRSLPKPGQPSPAVSKLQLKPAIAVDAPPPRPSKDGFNISISPPPPVLPDRSPRSEVAPKTKAESTSEVETDVPRYRRRPLPVVDLNSPPPKPYHSKPPSLPSLIPQLMRPRSDSQLESEVDSLLADIDHKPKLVKSDDGYSADDIYDDVAPDQKESQTSVLLSLGGVTTTASTDAYPCSDDIYDDVAADHNDPPEPPGQADELYDDIQVESKGREKRVESVESIVSAVSDSDDLVESTDDNLGNHVMPEGSPVPAEGGDTPTLNRKEMNKLKKQGKVKEKQLEKEKRLQKKKDEEDKKLKARMEAQRKKNFDRTKKQFKLKGNEPTQFKAHTLQAVSKAKKHFLTFSEGEEVDVLFTRGDQAPNKREFPEGAWLVVKTDGTVGYIDRTRLDGEGGSDTEKDMDDQHGYKDGEDLYEDIAAETVTPKILSPFPKLSLPPPSSPAPPPPSSPAPPPPSSPALPPPRGETNFSSALGQETYDDVSGGGLVEEEDLYEEL